MRSRLFDVAIPAIVIVLPLWAFGVLIFDRLNADDDAERRALRDAAVGAGRRIEAAAQEFLDARSSAVFARIETVRQADNTPGDLRRLILERDISLLLIRRGAQTLFPPNAEWDFPQGAAELRELRAAADLHSRSNLREGWYADVSGSVFFRCNGADAPSVCFSIKEDLLRGELTAALDRAAAQETGRSFLLRDPYGRAFWSRAPAAGAQAVSFLWSGAFRGWALEVGGAAAAKASATRLLTIGAPLALFWAYFVWSLIRRQAERMKEADSRKAFLARIAHDLRTPLANLKLFCELIAQETRGDATAAAHCAVLSSEIDRLDRLAANALTFGRAPAPRLTRAIPDERVHDQLEKFESRFLSCGAVCTIAASETAPLRFDVDGFDRILVNLLDNACKFAPGPMSLATRFEKGLLRIELRDRGPGLAGAGHAAAGAGLGLTIVRDIAQANGGALTMINGQDGLGVIVTLQAKIDEGDVRDLADSRG